MMWQWLLDWSGDRAASDVSGRWNRRGWRRRQRRVLRGLWIMQLRQSSVVRRRRCPTLRATQRSTLRPSTTLHYFRHLIQRRLRSLPVRLLHDWHRFPARLPRHRRVGAPLADSAIYRYDQRLNWKIRSPAVARVADRSGCQWWFSRLSCHLKNNTPLSISYQ